jgi:hypothetical protein
MGKDKLPTALCMLCVLQVREGVVPTLVRLMRGGKEQENLAMHATRLMAIVAQVREEVASTRSAQSRALRSA